MYVRLGFAIAAYLEPDILLLDEVLAVGDAGFQEKCIDRVLKLKQSQTTIVFISHDLNAVQKICDRVLVMRRGEIIVDADTPTAISEYRKTSRFDGAATRRTGGERAEITGVSILNNSGETITSVATGGPLRVQVDYHLPAPLRDVSLSLFFYSGISPDCDCQFTTGWLDLTEGGGTIEFSCEQTTLHPGVYRVDANIEQAGAADPLEWLLECLTLHVSGEKLTRGVYYHPHQWRVLARETAPVRDLRA
jgi:hypothetical protein